MSIVWPSSSALSWESPDRADLGTGEDGGRDQLVRGGGGAPHEGGLHKAHRLVDGDGGELEPAGHIAHGVDVVRRRARVLVHLDMSAQRQLHARVLKAETRDVRTAADGEHDLLGFDGLAGGRRHVNAGARCAGTR